jgi:beta-lactamase regulating signal transducer with metallopeptidase domain
MNTDAVLPVLFELLIKSALISLAAALLTRAWRGATAAQRHLVWLVALATILMLPATRLGAPLWKIPLTPAKPVTVVRMTLPNAHLAPIETDSSALETIAPAPVRISLDWRKVLLRVWLGGAVPLLGYRLFGSWRLHRLMRRSTLVDDPRIRLLLSRTLSELGLDRRPEIRLSEECRVPLTWGSLRPVMLLPKAVLQWNDTWLIAALRHEAGHIRRYDYLTRWFAHVAFAIYWPNPLVWLLARSLRVAQELAADDLVLRAGTPPEEYASQLVHAARAVTTHGFFVRQAVAMACPSTLEDRVRAIVDGGRDRRPLSRLAAACGSLTIALTLALSTAAQLRSDEQKPVPAPEPPAGVPAAPVDKSAAPAAGRSQIEIGSKFIEITTPPGKTARPVPEKPTIFSDPQFQVVLRALSQKKDVNLLSAPRVTTAPNQEAKVEIIREFHYPAGWKKDGRNWKSTTLETKNMGVTLDVTPRITETGAIELDAVATVVEFQGFVDMDNSDAATPKKKGSSWTTSGLPPVPAGHRSKPIFQELRSEKTVTLKSGETVEISDLHEVGSAKPPESDGYRRQILVFISPQILAPAPAKAAPKDGAAAAVDGDPAPPAESVARKKALEIVLPLFELRDATVPEAIDALTKQSAAFDPEKTGIKILLRLDKGPKNAPDPYPEDARVTIHLTNIPLIEAVKFVAGLANLEAVYTPGAVELRRAKPGTTGANPLFPALPEAAGLVTKEWKIPPEMIPGKPSADGADRVAAKEWLISKGVTFDGAAAAIFMPATSRLLVRNTPEQIARVDEIVSVAAGVVQDDPADDTEFLHRIYLELAGRLPSPAEVKAFLADPKPSAEKRKAIVDKLKTSSKTGAPNSGLKPAEPQVQMTAQRTYMENGITIGEGNVHLVFGNYDVRADTIRYDPATHSADLEGHAEVKNGPHLTQGDKVKVNFDTEFTSEPLGLQKTTEVAAATESAARAKAENIIIPKIELREATFEEALDLLRKKAVEFDPDKTGVKIVVKPGAVSDARITISLTNIPLIEALKYVASLANLKFVATPDALVVQPVGDGKF